MIHIVDVDIHKNWPNNVLENLKMFIVGTMFIITNYIIYYLNYTIVRINKLTYYLSDDYDLSI